jgi:hypothetical protein
VLSVEPPDAECEWWLESVVRLCVANCGFSTEISNSPHTGAHLVINAYHNSILAALNLVLSDTEDFAIREYEVYMGFLTLPHQFTWS